MTPNQEENLIKLQKTYLMLQGQRKIVERIYEKTNPMAVYITKKLDEHLFKLDSWINTIEDMIKNLLKQAA